MALIGFPLMVLIGGIVYIVVGIGHAVAPHLDTIAALIGLGFVTWLAPSWFRGFRSAYDGSTVAGWFGVAFWYSLCFGVWALVTWLV